MRAKRLSPDAVRYIREHYKDTLNKEIMRVTGATRMQIEGVRVKYRLTKSSEHISSIASESGLASQKARGGVWPGAYSPDTLARRGATFSKTYKTEKARLYFGLEQKTKIRVRIEPPQKTNQRSYLRRRGYVVDRDKSIAYFNENTRRCPLLEQSTRYFTFQAI